MPRTLSVEEYKELGKRYYSRKDYQKALESFTEGINASVKDDLQLYDYRAAAYEKLEKLQDAMLDSRSMIQIDGRDPRGYLRAGQLLLNQGKKDKALQIYDRGLRYVPAAHPQQHLLHASHKKLNLELCPPKSVDPLTQLPLELAEMILGYLKFYELVTCLRVSKGWKQFLVSNPPLWTTIDLVRPKSTTRRQPVFVKPSFVTKCIANSQNGISSARIANLGHRGVLQRLVTVCRHLEKLEFTNGSYGTDSIFEATLQARNLKNLVVHTHLPLPSVISLMNRRTNLEVIRIGIDSERYQQLPPLSAVLSNLKFLDVKFTKGHARDFVSCLRDKLPNLTELRITDPAVGADVSRLPPDAFASFTKLEVLTLVWESLCVFHDLPQSLKRLEQITRTSLPSLSITPWAASASLPKPQIRPLAALEHLELSGPFQAYHMHLFDVPAPVMDNDASSAVAPYAMLKSLKLVVGGEYNMTVEELQEMLRQPRLRSLEDLALMITYEASYNDALIKPLLELKKLKKLTLGLPGMTGMGLKRLVTGLRESLIELMLSGCHDVSHDAAEWVAKQGIACRVNDYW